MKRIFSLAVLLLAISPVFAAKEAKQGPLTTDEQFFSYLNLDYPGLESVRSDVGNQDYAAAKHDFVEYLKNRSSRWFFDWQDFNKASSRKKKFKTADADKFASNLLVSCGIWHQFGETVDWSINPTELKYNEWTWQLSRHPFWVTLGKAYWATGDEKYAKAFVSQMRSWVIQNPVPSKAANKPYSRWRTIESGIRMSGSWPNSLHYFLASPNFDDESVIMMVKSMYEHGAYLREFHRTNNWLTMEMNGLFHVAVLFPEFKNSEEWARYSSDKLYDEEKIQFYPDGAQIELTTGYHHVSIGNILGLYKYAVLCNYPLNPDYVKRLESAYDYYLNIISPDCIAPAVNDAGWGNVKSYFQEASECFPEREDFRYFATSGKEGRLPDFTSTWMPWAGWYTMRTGWDKDALYAFFEVGPFGAGHQHEDKLSLILNAYGRRVLTEGGTYAYDKSDWRKYIISARAHNVSRVDGNDQKRRLRVQEDAIKHSLAPMTNRWISNDKFDFGEGWYNEGFGENLDKTVTQYRALTLVKDRYWILVDVFTPSDNAVHSYASFFHFNTPEFVNLSKLNGVVSAEAGKPNLAIIRLDRKAKSFEVVCGRKEPEVQGWIPVGSTRNYDCKPVATPTFKREGAGQVVDPYIFVPVKADESCPVKAVKDVGTNEYEVRFIDGSKDRIRFETGADGALVSLSVNGDSVL